MLRHFLLPFLLLCLCTAVSFGQNEFTGRWTGYLTQEQGGFRPKYNFELRLEQKGNQVTGTSYASVDNIYAEFALEGTVNGKVLTFKEVRMIKYTRLEEMSWCFKWGDLKLVKHGGVWHLEGNWEGKSPFGPCIPGKVYLGKAVPRA